MGFLLRITLFALFLIPVPTLTAQPTLTDSWQAFKQQEGDDWELRASPTSSTPASVLFGTSRPYVGSPEQAARQFLGDHSDLFHIDTNSVHLKHQRTFTMNGVHHVRFQQFHQGVPIEEVIYLVHVRADGRITMANGAYYPDLSLASVQPTMSADRAIRRALSNKQALGQNEPSQASLVVLPISDSTSVQFRLGWKATVGPSEDPRVAIADAHTGELLHLTSSSFEIFSSEPRAETLRAEGQFLRQNTSFHSGTSANDYFNDTQHELQSGPTGNISYTSGH